jgi:alpha-glucosidase
MRAHLRRLGRLSAPRVRGAVALSCVLWWWGFAAGAPGCRAATQFAGDVRSTAVAADRVDFQLDRGAVARVQMMAPDLVRVRFNPAGAFTSWTSGAVAPDGLTPPAAAIYDTPSAVYLVSDRALVIVSKSPFGITILRPDNSLVMADIPHAFGWDSETGMIFHRHYALPGEHYFGLGLRGGPLNRRGRSFFMKNVDWFAYEEFTDPLYQSFPFYYGLRDGQAHGLFLDNPALPFFDMDSQQAGHVTFGAWHGELDYYVLTGPETSRVANTYARLTGFTPLPPRWTLGFHQSRYGYSSQAEMLELAATFRRLGLPCDALYLDIDYMDRLQLFSWDGANFPAPVAMNAALEDAGFKRVNIIDPVVRTDDRLWPFMAGSQYFLRSPAGAPLVNNIWYGDVSWIDFTKDSARAWYKQQLKVFLQTGVTAIWNDLNEPAQNFMPEAVYDFNGERRTDLQARNLYALKETSLSYEALRELRPDARPWVLSRSGFAGIQRYAANWSGDTLTSFDSLRVSVQISSSMGLSGQNQFGHDIGGFLGSPSPELFIRWMEFASFTPLFRNHAMNTSLPREPWAFGEPYTSIARATLQQRYRLLPYLYTVFEDAARRGQPVLAPTLFHFPGDPGTYTQDQDFMLGPSLLVAPVVTEGAVTRSVYLPAGSNWVDYHTDLTYGGGQHVTVPAPLERIPVFVREGTLLPTGPVSQHVDEPVPPRMTVDIYPGPATTFSLYEDDGRSFAYQQGHFLRTQLTRVEETGGTLFSIRATEGSFAVPPRPWWLHFHNTPASPAGVELDGAPLAPAPSEASLETATQGWFYRASDRRLIVRLQRSTSAQSVRVLRAHAGA